MFKTSLLDSQFLGWEQSVELAFKANIKSGISF